MIFLLQGAFPDHPSLLWSPLLYYLLSTSLKWHLFVISRQPWPPNPFHFLPTGTVKPLSIVLWPLFPPLQMPQCVKADHQSYRNELKLFRSKSFSPLWFSKYKLHISHTGLLLDRDYNSAGTGGLMWVSNNLRALSSKALHCFQTQGVTHLVFLKSV